MTDRETIELCAEICGFESDYWSESQRKLDVFQGDNFYKQFDPITDANDERLVLDWLQASDRGSDPHGLIFEYVMNELCDGYDALAGNLLATLKRGDIARAAAKAYKETNR